MGSSGNDVRALQQFLAQDPNVYPEGTVTGYFGSLTLKAVKRFQINHDIVSSGTPSTTGFGIVGARTRAAIASLCSGQKTAAHAGGYFTVTPISGTASLTVNGTAFVNTVNSCDSATYILDYGDGTQSQQIPVNAGACAQQTNDFSHTYQNAGTYQLTLSAGSHHTTATIVVTAPPQQSSAANNATPQSCTPAPMQTQTLNCPNGQTGAWTQMRTQYCPSGATTPVWGAWTDTANTCAAQTATQPATPTMQQASSCTFAGQTIKDGSRVLAFQNPSTSVGNGCAAVEERTCSNGKLSGSYQYDTCAWNSTSAAPPPTPTLNPITCGSDNTNAYLSWNSVQGSGITYSARMNMPLNLACTGAMTTIPGGSCASSTGVETLVTTADNSPLSVVAHIDPNTWYAWWVHSISSGNYSSVIAHTFKCPAQ